MRTLCHASNQIQVSLSDHCFLPLEQVSPVKFKEFPLESPSHVDAFFQLTDIFRKVSWIDRHKQPSGRHPDVDTCSPALSSSFYTILWCV